MDLLEVRERLRTARANERAYTEAGDRENAAKWARFARFLNELVKRWEKQ